MVNIKKIRAVVVVNEDFQKIPENYRLVGQL